MEKHGTYEYKVFRCDYDLTSESACLFFKHKYDEGKWELVCPVHTEVWQGSSSYDKFYIFRRWVEYTLPVNVHVV